MSHKLDLNEWCLAIIKCSPRQLATLQQKSCDSSIALLLTRNNMEKLSTP